ncbi:MAG: type II toxin-antitoxin system RelE/ParE family toxin [Nitrosomonadales bacterium]|nr:type II toxin-antitoxin system RelE/ParE family toxin [Nitrosomonadales bacterium]
MPPKQHLVSLSREAEADADAAVEWYIGEGAFIAADDFLGEIEQTMGMLARFPEVGEAGLHNMRMLPLHGFPYSLIYRLQADAIRIIAIAHHSRRPGYWVGRR